MWLPTFLQRGIHFFGERTEVLAFNNFVLFDRVHLTIIGKRAAVVEEDSLSVRELRPRKDHRGIDLTFRCAAIRSAVVRRAKRSHECSRLREVLQPFT
jgi:hypothetical protein